LEKVGYLTVIESQEMSTVHFFFIAHEFISYSYLKENVLDTFSSGSNEGLAESVHGNGF